MTGQLAFLFSGRSKDATIYLVTASPLRYRADFAQWLSINWQIWERFEREANAIYASGRKHYSARTIFEFIRHETALRDRDGEFKLNNNVFADCSRLYMTLHPERDGFFELRDGEARREAA